MSALNLNLVVLLSKVPSGRDIKGKGNKSLTHLCLTQGVGACLPACVMTSPRLFPASWRTQWVNRL